MAKLTEDVALVLKKVIWSDRERSLQNWKKRKVDKGGNSLGNIALHFRDPDQTPITILKTTEGKITGRIEEMDQILRDSWLPIFAKHSDPVKCAVPSVDWFMTRHAGFIPMVEQTFGTAHREGFTTSHWLDGWTTKDFKKLYGLILELLLLVYDVVEESGTWPEPFCWVASR